MHPNERWRREQRAKELAAQAERLLADKAYQDQRRREREAHAWDRLVFAGRF